jgi:hypothetical protein
MDNLIMRLYRRLFLPRGGDRGSDLKACLKAQAPSVRILGSYHRSRTSTSHRSAADAGPTQPGDSG